MKLHVEHGDCLEVLAEGRFPSNWADSVVTDPPYGLEFMGKIWDQKIPPDAVWRGVLRVAKPGAFLLCFGGTRTYHRLACAIEDAGWEIRDCIMWMYGTGFPKSHNISKAIDKEAGAEREVVGRKTFADGSKARRTQKLGGNATFKDPVSRESNLYVTAPATDAAKQWEGWGTALKPAYEPIIVAMKPCAETYAQNALKHGVAGINVDGCRVATLDKLGGGRLAGPTDMTNTCGGEEWDRPWMHDEGKKEEYAKRTKEKVDKAQQMGRWPANVVLDEEVGAMLDEQTGGGASRFFYCVKASRAERGEANNHPTVKPLALMEYLCKLTMPPGKGRVLDPFCGSGTTGVACARLGRAFLGIEKNIEYVETARKRIKEALVCES